MAIALFNRCIVSNSKDGKKNSKDEDVAYNVKALFSYPEQVEFIQQNTL